MINTLLQQKKAAGEIVEVRDYIDAARSKKRKQYFCFLAKTVDMEI